MGDQLPGSSSRGSGVASDFRRRRALPWHRSKPHLFDKVLVPVIVGENHVIDEYLTLRANRCDFDENHLHLAHPTRPHRLLRAKWGGPIVRRHDHDSALMGFATPQTGLEQPNILIRKIGDVPVPVDVHRNAPRARDPRRN
jgi:hypothetical protein